MTLALWIVAVVVAVALIAAIIVSNRASGIALRALHRSRGRVDRFKLTRKSFIRDTLLADEEIARAVTEHAAANSLPEGEAWKRVETYIDEIVPFFNILTYYRIGLVVARPL